MDEDRRNGHLTTQLDRTLPRALIRGLLEGVENGDVYGCETPDATRSSVSTGSEDDRLMSIHSAVHSSEDESRQRSLANAPLFTTTNLGSLARTTS